jgi:Putative Flp pilus-assembly TadE/G-like
MSRFVRRQASGRLQRGQAIVLIALMLAILVGMAALAIDGSRAYALRRDLQAAVDAALLTAGDNLQQTGSYSGAEQAATTVFGTNLRLYSAPSCSPGYGSPSASPWTVTCTYSDGTVLIDVVSALGPQGSQFSLTATRSQVLQFARILTNGVSPKIGATGAARVNNLLYSPALTTLNSAGCGGVPGNALTVSPGQTLTVIGDVVSNGTISVPVGGLKVAGDVYARCQASVSGLTSTCYPSGASTPCTFPDVAGTTRTGYRTADPNYPPPAVVGGSQGLPGSDVVLKPGLYSANPNFSSNLCYFLSGGVYSWPAGYTNGQGFVSNELKPPDEPESGDNTDLGNQMWATGGVNCAGSFDVSAVGGSAIFTGTWGVEVTSTRSDTFNGTSYGRESAPSMCREVDVGASQVIKVAISNVPGATGYNVYFSPPPNGCSGPFGFGGSITVSGPVRNNSTGSCPDTSGSSCSLGKESAMFDSILLGVFFAPNCSAALPVSGACPPTGETPPLRMNLPNQNPDRGTPPAGDRANENQCDTIVGAPTTCPSAVTPGAVTFYIPSGGCLNATTNADNFLFSGYQYDWVLVYEPGAGHPPANICSNQLGAEADSAWVGLVYVPSAALTVTKAATFRTEATGGLMADTMTFTGQLPTIIYNPGYAPAPPASKLVA